MSTTPLRHTVRAHYYTCTVGASRHRGKQAKDSFITLAPGVGEIVGHRPLKRFLKFDRRPFPSDFIITLQESISRSRHGRNLRTTGQLQVCNYWF
jgi:hypothetical protein